MASQCLLAFLLVGTIWFVGFVCYWDGHRKGYLAGIMDTKYPQTGKGVN